MNFSGKYMYNICNTYIYIYTFLNDAIKKINKTEDPSYDMNRQEPSKDAGEFTFCWLAAAVHIAYP